MQAALHALEFTPDAITNINAVDGRGLTPLHQLIYLSSELLRVHEVLHGSAHTRPIPEAVKTLLQHGANVNARDPEGFTPLHFVFVYRPSPMLGIVTALVDGGADGSAATFPGGYTPLHFACRLTDAATVTAALKAHGTDINRANTDAAGGAPLHFSIHPDISTVLINAGASINTKNVNIDRQASNHFCQILGRVSLVKHLSAVPLRPRVFCRNTEKLR